MPSKDKQLIEVAVEIKHETNAAILVTDGTEDYWMPKSQIKGEFIYTKGKTVTIEIPEWLAKTKGLI